MEKEIDLELKKRLNILIGFFLALILVVLFIGGIQLTSAMNISIADSTLVGNHSILVIDSDGTLIASGYSTQTFDIGNITDPTNATVIIHIKPENTNIIETPNTLLDEIVRQIQANMVAVVLIGLLAVVVLKR